MARRLLLVLIALLAPAAAASGQAPDTNAPPGLSSSDQYLETVPSGTGPKTVGNGQRPSLDDPTVRVTTNRALPLASVAELRRRGKDGEDAAALAGRTAPPPPANRSGLAGVAAASPDGRLASIGRIATGDSDGIGFLFPLLIVLGAIAATGSAWQRRTGPSA